MLTVLFLSVNVRRDQSVFELKEAIVLRKPHAFQEIDADNLVLSRIGVLSKQGKTFNNQDYIIKIHLMMWMKSGTISVEILSNSTST